MKQTPILVDDNVVATSLTEAELATLRVEITRLQRENRALSIALAEMERVAQRDMLTPLFNRRYFLSALHQRLANADRDGGRTALIYVDVDGLKRINDAHGHGAGDLALIEVAARLMESARRGDVVARIGGDEYGMLIDNIGAGEARALIRHMRAAIVSEPLELDEGNVQLSAAFGLTMLEAGRTAEDVIGSADADMYRSKRDH